MAQLVFQDLQFEENGDKVRFKFLDNFYFDVGKDELEAAGDFTAAANTISFPSLKEKEARGKLNSILDKGFENLTSSVTGKPTVYVNKYFGLPLIGSGAFGIVDRNSNMLEIKPVTGCNMNCIFCSVDEGLMTKKVSELVIDKDYLAEETRKVAESKDCSVHITINAHGEPTIYKPMHELIKDLRQIRNVKSVSLITNCTLIDEKYVDKLAAAGLTRLNVSLNAVSDKMAKILEGHGKYDVAHVKKICEYAAKKLEVMLAPVFVPGYNDGELDLIVKFAKKIGAKVGIQNFLHYDRGRTPMNAKQMPWEQFYEKLKKLEEENYFKLIYDEKDFGITKTKPLPKPFRKGQIIEAVIKCGGRYKGEAIAAAMDRNITVTDYAENAVNNKKARIKITSDKHNIFFGKMV